MECCNLPSDFLNGHVDCVVRGLSVMFTNSCLGKALLSAFISMCLDSIELPCIAQYTVFCLQCNHTVSAVLCVTVTAVIVLYV